MSQVSDIADYVRQQGQGNPVTVAEAAKQTGLSRPAVVSARAELTRKADDIRPIAPSTMAYWPNWKEEFPAEWEAAQERTRASIAGKKRAGETDREIARQRVSKMPNVIGPVTMIHNVMAVNVHPDHVAIQHADGTWTEFDGTLVIREK